MSSTASIARRLLHAAPWVLVPALVATVAFAVSGSHRILPGMTGCELVRNTMPRIDCYAEQISAMAKDMGAEAAMASVEARAENNQSFAADCHLASHPLGESQGRATAVSGEQLRKSDATGWCVQGYAHGYIIGYFENAAIDARQAPAAVMTACGAEGGQNPLTCLHSFGHVFARGSQGDLAAGDAACAAVPYGRLATSGEADGQSLRKECIRGLYMEYNLLEMRGELPAIDCAGAPAASRTECFAWLPQRVTFRGGTLQEAAQACQTQAAGAARGACAERFAELALRPSDCELLPKGVERERCASAVSRA